MAISGFSGAKSGYKPTTTKPKKQTGTQNALPNKFTKPLSETGRGQKVDIPVTPTSPTRTQGSQPTNQIAPTPYVSPTGAVSTPSNNPYGGFSTGGGQVPDSIAGYGYTPEGLASIYGAPTILANDILAGMGINNPGLAESLAQYLDPAIAANFILGKGMGDSSSDASSIGYGADYMQQMVTPNGQVPGFQELAAALLQADSGDSSPLGAYLNSGLTPEQQVGQFAGNQGIFGQTLAGLNPYAQQAYKRYAEDQGNQYLGGVAHGQPDGTSFVDYLRGTNLSKWIK